MKRNLITLLVVFFLGVFGMSSFAAEEPTDNSPSCKIGEVFEGNLNTSEEGTAPDEIHWDFITCTRNQSECAWEAYYHGYHHYQAIHDHYYCNGFAHLACYGGHH